MMATYRDGHFYCEYHGDLGEHDEAIANETVAYSGEDQQNGFFCVQCLGEEGEPPAIAPEHEAMNLWLARQVEEREAD